jgi:hypothetical protein
MSTDQQTGTLTKYPKVTLSFISYNRLHYLRATLESARECIQYPNLEWIVSDGASREPGLREYLDSLDWVDHKLQHTSHPQAMNQIVEKTTGEFLLIWPEDVQFTVRGDWMKDIVEIMSQNKWIGSTWLDYARRKTIEAFFNPSLWANKRRLLDEFVHLRGKVRRAKILSSSRGFRVRTLGWVESGIVGSGIPSLTRTNVWRTLGPWRTASELKTKMTDSSLGAEDDMLDRFYESRLPLQRATPLVPVAADIITDSTGCKAKVRGKYRYGVYFPPPSGRYYYRIRDLSELLPHDSDLPTNFTDGVEPIGFKLPFDANGDRLKSAINKSVVFDLEKQCEVAAGTMTE